MAITLDMTGEVISAVLFLMVCLFFVLIYIAYLLKNIKVGGVSEKIIEKHFVSSAGKDVRGDNSAETVNKSNHEETPEERKKRIEESIQYEEKWKKEKDIKSNINDIGNKTVVDGSKAMDAVNLMRKMGKGKVKEDE